MASLNILQKLITIVAALLGGLWAWSKYVLERGLMPPSSMDIQMSTVESREHDTLVQFEVTIANKGQSTLIVGDLRLTLRYLNGEDALHNNENLSAPSFGRVRFSRAHVHEAPPLKKGDLSTNHLRSGEFRMVPYDTFVQPGVEQGYPFATVLPAAASIVLAQTSFRYQLRPSSAQKRILRLSRKLGMVQYTLDHVSQPHTAERVFNIHKC